MQQYNNYSKEGIIYIFKLVNQIYFMLLYLAHQFQVLSCILILKISPPLNSVDLEFPNIFID
jgi:hypothetical protein